MENETEGATSATEEPRVDAGADLTPSAETDTSLDAPAADEPEAVADEPAERDLAAEIDALKAENAALTVRLDALDLRLRHFL